MYNISHRFDDIIAKHPAVTSPHSCQSHPNLPTPTFPSFSSAITVLFRYFSIMTVSNAIQYWRSRCWLINSHVVQESGHVTRYCQREGGRRRVTWRNCAVNQTARCPRFSSANEIWNRIHPTKNLDEKPEITTEKRTRNKIKILQKDKKNIGISNQWCLKQKRNRWDFDGTVLRY